MRVKPKFKVGDLVYFGRNFRIIVKIDKKNDLYYVYKQEFNQVITEGISRSDLIWELGV